jgi:transposase InsO family protein
MSQVHDKRAEQAGSGNGTKATESPYKRRFSDEQRKHALVLVASGVGVSEAARIIGTTDKSIRSWVSRAQAAGTMPDVPVAAKQSQSASETRDEGVGCVVQAQTEVTDKAEATARQTVTGEQGAVKRGNGKSTSVYAPADPGQGLADVEVAAILEIKKAHPSYGPAQLRAQLKRFRGWRIANKAIARVLKQNGYELVHRGSQPKGFEPQRFEAPRRNALWQLDFVQLRLADGQFYVLVVLDDFSRYVVGHICCDRPEADSAVTLLRQCFARHGKPEAVRTDRGGAFMAAPFSQALEAELIDHSVGQSYHPQGGGKVESVMGTLRRELWDVEHFAHRPQAERRIDEFFAHYNEARAHMGIDGLTPADRYFGRADRVLAHIDAISRKRNAATALHAPSGAPIEEICVTASQAPMEVLRLVVVDGQMQLRLCGACVQLGPVQHSPLLGRVAARQGE